MLNSIFITGWFQEPMRDVESKRQFALTMSTTLESLGYRTIVFDFVPGDDYLKLGPDSFQVSGNVFGILPWIFPKRGADGTWQWRRPNFFQNAMAAFGVALSLTKFLIFAWWFRPSFVLSYNGNVMVHRAMRLVCLVLKLPWHAVEKSLYEKCFEISPFGNHGLALSDARICPQTQYENESKPAGAPGLRVLVLGSGEYCNGLWPRWSARSKRVSPHFASDQHLSKKLVEIAEKNDWSVTYRPHPECPMIGWKMGARLRIEFESNPESLEAIILRHDVCVTLLSSSILRSIELEKPSVLIGRNALTGSGAIYELNNEDELEFQIVRAWKSGLTVEMKRALSRFLCLEGKGNGRAVYVSISHPQVPLAKEAFKFLETCHYETDLYDSNCRIEGNKKTLTP